MLEQECEVPIYQGDEQEDVVYQAGSGSREADKPSEEGESASALAHEYTGGSDRDGPGRTNSYAAAPPRDRVASKEQAASAASARSLQSENESTKLWAGHIQTACAI